MRQFERIITLEKQNSKSDLKGDAVKESAQSM